MLMTLFRLIFRERHLRKKQSINETFQYTEAPTRVKQKSLTYFMYNFIYIMPILYGDQVQHAYSNPY